MKSLISIPRQRLGGFVNRGHPSGGGHDPLSIMDAADVCLVDHLTAAGQPLAGDTVYHRRLHLPEIRGHDSKGHHELRHPLTGTEAQHCGGGIQHIDPLGAEIIRQYPPVVAAVVGLVNDLVVAGYIVGSSHDFVQRRKCRQGDSDR